MLIPRVGRLLSSAVLTLGLVYASAACSVILPVGPDEFGGDVNDLQSVAQYCVDQINILRASAGAPPLMSADDVSAFSTAAATVDGAAHQAHKHFRETDGGGGTSTAETEILWWKLTNYSSVHSVVRQGLLKMWQQGKGGEHYDNLMGPYRQVGCGIAVIGGEVTVSQDFR